MQSPGEQLGGQESLLITAADYWALSCVTHICSHEIPELPIRYYIIQTEWKKKKERKRLSCNRRFHDTVTVVTSKPDEEASTCVHGESYLWIESSFDLTFSIVFSDVICQYDADNQWRSWQTVMHQKWYCLLTACCLQYWFSSHFRM